MGIAAVLAENERLRLAMAARDAEHARALSERDAQLSERDSQLAERAAQLAERDAKIAALTLSNDELAQRLELQRLKLAGRRNERHVENTLFAALVASADRAPPPRSPVPEGEEPPPVDAKPAKKPRGKQQRRDLSKKKDRPVHHVPCTIDPASTCAKCGGPFKLIGTAHGYRVDWVPGHFVTLDVERERCACPKCPTEGVQIAPTGFALPRALCGNGLLARVLVDKFADRIPLNLQATRMEREGELFSTATLSDWVLAGAAYLLPIAVAIENRLLAGRWLQADDTGYPVQDGLDGRLRKGRLWAMTDQQEVRYHFTATKEGTNPAAFLAQFKGKLLLVDGGSEFNLAVQQRGLLRAGCWCHLRRYFFDARHHHPKEAALALATIRDLFAIEDGLDGADLALIREVRNRDSRPLVEGLFEWILGLRLATRPSSLLGEALTYAVNGSEFFRRFLDHPELPMHNNRSELALRGPVVGRKQWLFAGSEGGAIAGATMFTLTGSCMMQGIDPWAYIVDVLGKLADHPVNRVHELTPRGWRLARDRALTP